MRSTPDRFIEDNGPVKRSPEPMIVACPRCRRRGPWLETKWKPFCSERCRLVDLGHWFEGNYKISEPLRPEHFAEFEGTDLDISDDRPGE